MSKLLPRADHSTSFEQSAVREELATPACIKFAQPFYKARPLSHSFVHNTLLLLLQYQQHLESLYYVVSSSFMPFAWTLLIYVLYLSEESALLCSSRLSLLTLTL